VLHQHHDLIGVMSGDFFILDRSPLSHGAVREKVFPHELEKLLLISEGGLELKEEDGVLKGRGEMVAAKG
jgi:hypothetical protein